MTLQIIEIPNLPWNQSIETDRVNLTTDALRDSGESLTERTNAKTRYRYTADTTDVGWFVLPCSIGGVYIGSFYVKLDNIARVHIAHDLPPDLEERIWTYTLRTLTLGAGESTSSQDGSILTLYRGDSIRLTFSGLGSLAGRTKLWFGGKQHTGMTDSEADVVIEEGQGLITINGSSPEDAGDALITVTDEDAGDLEVEIKPGASQLLQEFVEGRYDIQLLDADDRIVTVARGELNVSGDVVRSVN